MVENDVQLIRRILSDDDEAFSILVQKYQKSVHALAWRKVNDFHYAEEITQDTFLQAYKKLSTLKNPNQFAGWLYVIANRLCINWLNRHKPAMQSLEDTPMEEIEESAYNHHAAEQREAEGTKYRYEIVQKLLSKLPESERTVVTLYYLGEMTAKEISKFLGVSVNTITSRLRRARERLQKDQELLVQEVLGGVQLRTNLTENIMRQVADLRPTPPPVAKPLLPWGAFGIATLLVALLLGATGQYLVRFQRPYSFEAASEPTVELVDTFILLDIDSKPDVRNQVGRATSANKNIGAGLQTSDTPLVPEKRGNSLRFSTAQWTRKADMPTARSYFSTSVMDGKIYAIGGTSIFNEQYRLETVEVYDPSTDTWAKASDLNHARSCAALSVVNGEIYAMGGWGLSEIQDQRDPILSSIEVFNLKINQWQERTGMIAPKTSHAASVINGKIYVTGGYFREGEEYKTLSTIEIYDPATDHWTQEPDMLIGRSGHTTEVIDGQIYIFGGDSNNFYDRLTSVEVYDPRTVSQHVN